MISLAVQARPKKAAKDLRKEDLVPCVVYGNEVENTSMTAIHNDLFRVYAKAGESSIIELDLDGKKIPVLVHAIDFDPVYDKITHVDFYAVNMKKEIETSVPVHFVGEAPAVKELGGVFVSVHDHVTVTCLPTDLPHALEVNIEKVETFQDAVTVADIVVPDGVTIQDDIEQVLCTAQEPRRAEPEPTEGETEGDGEAAAEGGEGDEEKKEEASADAEKSE